METNIFTQFKPEVTTHYIKALDGDVKLQSLTLKQLSDISSSLLNGVDSDGKPKLDMQKALRVKYVKLSMALVEPKMTAEELESLSGEAAEALKEIMFIVDPTAAEAEAAAEAEHLNKKIPNDQEG